MAATLGQGKLRLAGITANDGFAGTLGEAIKKVVDLLRLRDHLLHHEVYKLEKSRNKTLLFLEADLARVYGVVPNYANNVHGLLELARHPSRNQGTDLDVEIVPARDEFIHEQL